MRADRKSTITSLRFRIDFAFLPRWLPIALNFDFSIHIRLFGTFIINIVHVLMFISNAIANFQTDRIVCGGLLLLYSQNDIRLYMIDRLLAYNST